MLESLRGSKSIFLGNYIFYCKCKIAVAAREFTISAPPPSTLVNALGLITQNKTFTLLSVYLVPVLGTGAITYYCYLGSLYR